MSNPIQTDKPRASTGAAAPSPSAAVALVSARVRPNNRYAIKGEGDAIVYKVAGEIVQVPESELRQCAHALIALSDERAQEEATAAEPQEQKPGNHYFRAFKAQAIEALQIGRDNARRAKQRELEALGLTVAAK